MGKHLKGQFTKGDIQMTNKYIKRHSISLVTREISIKTHKNTTKEPEWLKFKTTQISNANKNAEQHNFHILLDVGQRGAKLVQSFGKCWHYLLQLIIIIYTKSSNSIPSYISDRKYLPICTRKNKNTHKRSITKIRTHPNV